MSTCQEKIGFAGRATHQAVVVQRNERVARDTYLLQFEVADWPSTVVAGQFVMVRIQGCDDPLIGRPLALYDVHATEILPYAESKSDASSRYQVQVMYLVHGKMTRRLATLQPGQKLEVWGPLGNGFSVPSVDHLIMVAGGIGQTPFLLLAKQILGSQTGRQADTARPQVTLCYGARSADSLARVSDFQEAGVEVLVSTDDGTAGRSGRVTGVLEPLLRVAQAGRTQVVCCGPEPMMKAVAALCHQCQVPALVSLETPMACGIGICFSCVAPVYDGESQFDYRRTCIEGPVFDACHIAWDEMD